MEDREWTRNEQTDIGEGWAMLGAQNKNVCKQNSIYGHRKQGKGLTFRNFMRC